LRQPRREVAYKDPVVSFFKVKLALKGIYIKVSRHAYIIAGNPLSVDYHTCGRVGVHFLIVLQNGSHLCLGIIVLRSFPWRFIIGIHSWNKIDAVVVQQHLPPGASLWIHDDLHHYLGSRDLGLYQTMKLHGIGDYSKRGLASKRICNYTLRIKCYERVTVLEVIIYCQ